jgi:hypothetical protein
MKRMRTAMQMPNCSSSLREEEGLGVGGWGLGIGGSVVRGKAPDKDEEVVSAEMADDVDGEHRKAYYDGGDAVEVAVGVYVGGTVR